MARADSTIRVNIIGDAKSLTKAADKAEGSIKGMNSQLLKVGGIVAGAFVTREIIDFGQTALDEADRVGDATGRLEDQLGNLSGPLVDAADEFARLGASEGDMLELEARITDIGIAAGISKGELADMADDAAATAAGLALITDEDADVWIDRIGKAAGGAEKPLKDLGINLTDTEVAARALADTGKDSAEQLTENELAAARLELILEKLTPRLEEVNTGTGDLEQKQAELQARMETLTGKIGEHLEGPLNDLAEWVLTGIDGWEMLGEKLQEADVDLGLVKDAVLLLIAPFTKVNDLLRTFIDLLGQIPSGFGVGLGGFQTNNRVNINSPDSKVNINVQGGSPEAIEQAVRRAVLTVGRRG